MGSRSTGLRQSGPGWGERKKFSLWVGGRGFHKFALEQEACLQGKTPEWGRQQPCSLYPAGSEEAWVWVRLLCGPRNVLLCLLIAVSPSGSWWKYLSCSHCISGA